MKGLAKMERKNEITLSEYIEDFWILRKKHDVKFSTLVRYQCLSKRIKAALGDRQLNQISPCDVYCFYDNLHEAKSESSVYVPTEDCVRILKLKYTRPQIHTFGIGMGTVDALRAGKPVVKKTALKVAKNLNMSINFLFREKATGLSDRTVLHYHRLLFSIFKDAEYDGFIETNIMHRIRPPKLTDTNEARSLDKEDAEKVMTFLKSFGEYPYSYLLRLIVYTGLRRGEVCGLEWHDVDFENNTITVCRTSYYLPQVGIYTDTPKTKQSQRTLAIGNKVIDILREVKAYQEEQGAGWNTSDRIFTYADGTILNPNSVTKYFHKFVEQYELPQCSVHTLRHTNASLMIANNTPITTVSGRLGHSNPEITFRYYAHQISEENRKAANAIEELI